MLALFAVGALALAAPALEDVDYVADVEFAVQAIEEQCGGLIRLKEIDWKKVSKQFVKEAAKVENDTEHYVLLVRLLARLRDGHARVENPHQIAWREEPERTGPGLSLCRVGKKLYVKRSWSDAAELGVEPGMEVVKIDGTKAVKWLEERIEEVSDMQSFSTDQHALFWTCQHGLMMPVGTRLDLELKTNGRKKKRTITYSKAKTYNPGPAVMPEGLTRVGERDQQCGVLPSGFGYMHIRRVPGELPQEVDEMLAKIGDVPGLVVDCRGNTGGGCDHQAVLARFIAKGETLQLRKGPLESAGPNPFGGPLVVIVDGTVVSAGETISGQLREERDGIMIGDSPTAGMSAQKTTIELPSGKFGLYVSIGSNRSSFQGGRGIEGIGMIPDEIVEYDPKDLAEGRDTLIERAVEILEKANK